MEKENKIRIFCTNCLYSKILPKHESDPKKTKIIVTDSCDKCCVEELDGIRYFDINLKEIKVKINEEKN